MATTTEFTPKKTNHVLHGLLTLVTFGGWATVWITAAICNSGAYERKESFTTGN